MEEPCHRRNPVTGGALSPYPLPHSRPFGCYVKAKLPGHTHTRTGQESPSRRGRARPAGWPSTRKGRQVRAIINSSRILFAFGSHDNPEEI